MTARDLAAARPELLVGDDRCLCRLVAYVTGSHTVPSPDARIDVDIVLDSLQAFELATLIDSVDAIERTLLSSGATLQSLCVECRASGPIR